MFFTNLTLSQGLWTIFWHFSPENYTCFHIILRFFCPGFNPCSNGMGIKLNWSDHHNQIYLS